MEDLVEHLASAPVFAKAHEPCHLCVYLLHMLKVSWMLRTKYIMRTGISGGRGSKCHIQGNSRGWRGLNNLSGDRKYWGEGGRKIIFRFVCGCVCVCCVLGGVWIFSGTKRFQLLKSNGKVRIHS